MGIIRKMNGFDANGCDSYYFCGIIKVCTVSK